MKPIFGLMKSHMIEEDTDPACCCCVDKDDGLLNSSKAVDDRLFFVCRRFLSLRFISKHYDNRTHNSSSSSHAEKKSFVALKLCGCHPKKNY